jgi:glyoxylase-like metal-dependent hydrolase (beta-lactamase superfamily II)/ferredoxin
MADRRRRLLNNAAGEFFVDSTCINCDTCRQLAPATFDEADDYSFVRRQPESAEERRHALQALIACPAGSIGAGNSSDVRATIRDFPLLIEDNVYYCGFNSPKSYGSGSYLVLHPDGNWLVDSPRYTEHLAREFERFGGVAYVFLTHRDDVADADHWARRFGSTRIIHKLERAAQPDAEWIIDGSDPITLAPGFIAIPTPGHTRGHCVLLHDQFLFTGDHLNWSRENQHLSAPRSKCWYSWSQQTASMAALRTWDFEWVLPGHGQRVRLSKNEMHRHLNELVERMSQQNWDDRW